MIAYALRIVRSALSGAALVAASAFSTLVLPSSAEAQVQTRADTECPVYFGQDTCAARMPQDATDRARARAFCGALKEAADALLQGARPGFRMQAGQDFWQGEVNEHSVMWGNVRGRGLYNYDARAPDARRRYELTFFFPGVSAAELDGGLNVCPAFYQTVTGTASTPILFRRPPNQGAIEMIVSAEEREYNSQVGAHESGAIISLVRQ